MNWKWKRKWLLSLAVTFSMVFSTVGTAAATGPTDPTVTTDTESAAGLGTGEAANPGSGDETGSDSGGGTDSDSGAETNPDIGGEANPDTGGETNPDNGAEANPDNGNESDPDNGAETNPDIGGETNPDTGGETNPDNGAETNPDSGSESDPDNGAEADPDAGDEADPDNGAETNPDNGGESDPDNGAETNPDNGDVTDRDNGKDTDSDTEGETKPDIGGDSGEEDLPEDSNDELLADPEDPDGKQSEDLTSEIHEHNWSVDWSYDENGHWHECDEEGCPVTDNSEKEGFAEHSYSADNVCTECGYFDPADLLARVATGPVPTYQEAYENMIALKEDYPEGMTWTNFTPYGSDGPLGDSYVWNGGKIYGSNRGVGCSAFAFILSDEAFGYLPARVITKGNFTFEDVKVGDILRVNNNSHSVIVLQKSAGGVVIAEANHNKSVHWGRVLNKSEVLTANFIITRYPEGYAPLDDPEDEELIQDGTIGNLNWSLTNAEVLTISGNGEIPDYSDGDLLPWDGYNVNTIVIEKGVTGIGDYVFCGSDALSVYIPDGVTNIGAGAFKGSALISVTIPGTVVDIGSDAFHNCANLTSVTVSEGAETIGNNAFRGCTSLAYIDFPASITSVGTGAFMSCSKMTRVRFMPGTGTVSLGDNLFSQCWELTSVTLPQTTDCISAGMFQSCTSLLSLYIPASVKEIGEGSFASCGVQTIYFGGSEAEWESMITPYLKPMLQHTTVIFNVEFDDPFAADPNDPGDFHPDDDENAHKHNWSQNWSYDETSHWHECNADCHITDNRNKDGYGMHSYGGWIIDVRATASQSGSRHRECRVCYYRQTVSIPATGSSGGSSGGSSSGSGGSSDESDSEATTNVEQFSDGSRITTTTQKDGTVTRISADAAGRVEAEVTLSSLTVSNARQRGVAVSLPIPAVLAVRDLTTAPAITVHTGSEPAKVAIPAQSPAPGTVAVILHEDGSTEVMKASVPTKDSVVAILPDGVTVKIMDNSKSFLDVPAGNQFEKAVAFVTARELLDGTTAETFAPDGPMSCAMLMTALARFDGAETNGGATWYTKSMEWAAARGISNGANPDSNMTGEELITILWKYMGSPVNVITPSYYADTNPTSDSQAAMSWAMRNGIVNGYENGSPDLGGQITRGQAAQLIMDFVTAATLNPVR